MLRQLGVGVLMILTSFVVGSIATISSLVALKAPVPDMKINLDLNDRPIEQPKHKGNHSCPACGMG
ncbi:MAG: hypothetical protein MUD14_05805 [Hydrococcus sp. Prado102]|jgi:hypothetical protein|nr:hypothetical protein [Hydrococcus sp. Prado102]